MRELKHIDVLSAAKVSAVLAAIWGFIIALISLPFITMAGTAIGGASSAGFNVAPLLVGFGAASIIIAPIVMAVLGFISGAIAAFLYNVVAGWIGGVKLDL